MSRYIIKGTPHVHQERVHLMELGIQIGMVLMFGQPFKLKFATHSVLDVLIRERMPRISWQEACLCRRRHCTLPGGVQRSRPSYSLTWDCGLWLVAFESVAYIQNDATCLSYMVQWEICKCWKPYMSPDPSSPFSGEICLRASEICQVWML